MLYAEQAVHTSESSRYKTQALVNFMIALRRSCFDVRDLGRVLAAIMRRVDLVSSLQQAPDPRCRRLPDRDRRHRLVGDRKSTRLNSSHANISYAVFCLKKKKKKK